MVVSGGEGDDTINISGVILKASATKYLVQYNLGDGNDLITGFGATSTLSISGGVHADSTKSGNDVIVTVSGNKITLQGAAGLSKLNIVETPVTITTQPATKT